MNRLIHFSVVISPGLVRVARVPNKLGPPGWVLGGPGRAVLTVTGAGASSSQVLPAVRSRSGAEAVQQSAT